MALKKTLPRGTMGIREPIWKDNSKVIGQFIKTEGLKPAKIGITANEVALKFNPKHLPGIPVPHLHFGDKTYTLTGQQWSKLTAHINSELTRKISAVKPVDIADITEISNAIHRKTR